MASIGYRKKGDAGPLYNPERDYAYITPTLMRMAIENLDSPGTALAAWREQAQITETEIVQIAEALADAQRSFVDAVDPVSSFDQALRRYGFYDARPVVQQFLFAAIGEVCCAAWFKAVREVSVVGEESPVAEDMARFTAAVREFAVHMKRPWYDANFMAEHLRLVNDTLQARIQVLGRQLSQATQALAAAEAVAAAEKSASLGAPWWRQIWTYMKGNKCQSTGCTKTPRSSGRG